MKTLTDRRILFCFNQLKYPLGGRNVTIDFIHELQRMGIAAHPVYFHPKHTHYPFKKLDAEPLFFPPLAKIMATWTRALERRSEFIFKFQKTRVAIPLPDCWPIIWRALYSLEARLRILHSRTAVLFGGCRSLNLLPTDIIMASDTSYPAIKEMFPDNLKVLAVQNSHYLMSTYLNYGMPEKVDFPFTFAISEFTKAATESIYVGEVAHIPLAVGSGEAGVFPCRKKRQIAFFPRKRTFEQKILTKAIQKFLPDWRVVKMTYANEAERDAVLRESAIFLSFSLKEGFGLPPAEAMRAGALVVGYIGVGGAEYMTRETCVPVLDDDIVSFVAELRKAAGSFREDGMFSEEYEKIRRNGYNTVNTKYSHENFRRAFHAFWSRVDNSLSDI